MLSHKCLLCRVLSRVTTALNADSCSGSEPSVLGSTSDDFTVAQPEPLLRHELLSGSRSQSPSTPPRRAGPQASSLGDRGTFRASFSDQMPAVPPVVTRIYHQLWVGPSLSSRLGNSTAEVSAADELEQQLVGTEHGISSCHSRGDLSEGALLSGTDQPRLSRAASRSVSELPIEGLNLTAITKSSEVPPCAAQPLSCCVAPGWFLPKQRGGPARRIGRLTDTSSLLGRARPSSQHSFHSGGAQLVSA